MIILALNAGSSSLKFSVLDTAQGSKLIDGRVEKLSTGAPEGQIETSSSDSVDFSLSEDSHKAAIIEVIQRINTYLDAHQLSLGAIGHRVVHGGDLFSNAVSITEEVIAEIHRLSPLAPLHNPANATVIEAAFEQFPDLPQVAVFDTAFHQTISEEVFRYAVPNEWYEKLKVRRYGFHGTSHSYVSRRAIELFGLCPDSSNLIIAHLGNGCSATAVHGGKSVDTTMGLSPLEGFVMGTRSGNVDPNLHSYIANQTDLSLEQITDILNKKSGLLALSGGFSDMRAIHQEAANGSAEATLAISVFIYRLAKEIIALLAALPGKLDAIVFTGGIGENDAYVRSQICKRLHFLGLELDKEENSIRRSTERQISSSSSEGSLIAAIIPTNEELEIAIQTESTL
ncbi:acetate kinase [Akkermansiaceae bacterium]|nr:acetate kinase [Akkermansiaceae bacterium]